jgi:hypothetical protein
MAILADTTMESRAEQQRKIRELVREVQRAFRDGPLKVNPELDHQIRKQLQRTQEQGRE